MRLNITTEQNNAQ